MLKSPLRYPGGKSRALKQILPLLPQQIEEYREPFLGGGSVFVRLKQKYPETKKFWINDRYKALFSFWSNLPESTEALLGQVKMWREEFPEGKKLHRFLKENQTDFSSLEQGAAFFIFNRITFSGTSEAGGFSKQAFEKRFTASSIQRVRDLQKVFTESVKITNLDYQEVVEAKSDREVFIFLDPPYYSAQKSALYGKNGELHRNFDHNRLARTLKNTSYQWLMTYDDSPFIRELYQDFAYLKSWDLTYGMRNVNASADSVGKELFIANYPLEANESQHLNLFSSKI